MWVERGVTVLEAARAGGIALAAGCGSRGTCGNCAVRVISGKLEAPDEIESSGLQGAPAGIRLACRARVLAPSEVGVLYSAASFAEKSASHGRGSAFVAGVDLGTTSVSAVLIGAEDGVELARATVENQQRTYGADVLSRLSAALDGAAADLRLLAERSVLAALQSAAEAADVPLEDLRRVAVAANSAMAALFVGADVSALAVHPFQVPSILRAPILSAVLRDAIGDVPLVVLPAVASFVGGDLLADIIAIGLPEGEGSRLLVDLGTNAEIALIEPGSLTVASVPAGSAFEGIGLFRGGPAVPGAIDRVEIGRDGAIALQTIGNLSPRWFSGAGLVSAVAQLVKVGAVSREGAIIAESPLADRAVLLEAGVIGIDLGQPGQGLIVSQLDIRALQLAKAALQVGIDRVLSEVHATGAHITELLVAGAFGRALHPGTLAELGFIPQSFLAHTRPIGNAALRGAAIVALDPSALDRYEPLVGSARHIELAAEPSFGRALVTATFLEPWVR